MSNSQGVSGDGVSPALQEAVLIPDAAANGRQPGVLARIPVSADALRALPAEFVKRHRVLPVKIQDGMLHIFTATPGNERVRDDIRLLTGLEVHESEAPGNEVI